MTNMKIRLLTATTLATLASAANAQFVLPAAELRGAGATSVGPVLVTSLNCVGQPNTDLAGNPTTLPTGLWFYGTNSGQQNPQAAGVYAPTSPTTANPARNCGTQEIQPNFEAKYVGTGSGVGRTWWRTFTNQLTGATGSINPFVSGTYPAWTNLQFAFSDAPVSAADLTAYNATARGAVTGTTTAPIYAQAGNAIAFPLFVFPIAFAYLPTYGYNAAGAPLNFNVKVPAKLTVSGVSRVIGGLRLNREAYCRIWNGDITNWNHPLLQRLNGGSATNAGTSLRSLSDNATRWTNEGAPIRLVGRFETSGTTDAFARHLAAVCTGVTRTDVSAADIAAGNTAGTTIVNRFTQASDALPYNTASGIDLRSFGSTRYRTDNTGSVAGTINSISGAFYNRVTNTIDTTRGNETAGLFMVAEGSSGVAAAVAQEGSSLRASTDPNGSGFLLNGKFGYISSDWVVPSPSRVNGNATPLFSASVNVAGTTSYLSPLPANAAKAFGTLLPPQSTATSGAFSTAETRTSALGGTLDRSRPQDWAQAVYPTSLTGLAAPSAGYPITGVSFMLTYTCFSTPAKRLATAQTIGLLIGKVLRDSTNAPLAANLFKGTGATSLGLYAQQNLAIVPAGWQTAISETFLKRSTQASNGVVLGAQNLWIQSAAPATATSVVTANPTCTAGAGA